MTEPSEQKHFLHMSKPCVGPCRMCRMIANDGSEDI